MVGEALNLVPVHEKIKRIEELFDAEKLGPHYE
jgi:hypothetical protein